MKYLPMQPIELKMSMPIDPSHLPLPKTSRATRSLPNNSDNPSKVFSSSDIIEVEIEDEYDRRIPSPPLINNTADEEN